MSLNPSERQAIIDFLTTNSDSWKGRGDGEILKSFSDEKLAALKVAAEKEKHITEVANAAANGFSDGNSQYRINPETGKWEKKVNNAELPTPKVKIAAPQGSGQSRPDMDAAARKGLMDTLGVDDEGMPADQVRRENRRRMRGDGPTSSTVNSDDDTPSLPPRPRTTEEWFRLAPVEVQNQYRASQEIEKREKSRIVNEILANSNVSEQDRQVHHERLMRRSVEELNNDLAMMHRVIPDDTRHSKPRSTSPPTRNRTNDDMLVLPTMNWQEVGTEEEARPTPSTSNTANNDSDEYSNEPSEEEMISQLPPNLRRKVAEANVIQNREKQKLIQEIVNSASLHDDEEGERRLVSRLQNKSLAELQDWAMVTNRKKEQSRINYFGGGATTQTTNNRGNDPTEDVLPLPTMNWSKQG